MAYTSHEKYQNKSAWVVRYFLLEYFRKHGAIFKRRNTDGNSSSRQSRLRKREGKEIMNNSCKSRLKPKLQQLHRQQHLLPRTAPASRLSRTSSGTMAAACKTILTLF